MNFLRLAFIAAVYSVLLPCRGQPLYFENYNTRNGLSSNEITCVYEDPAGFLWIGTRDGLNRFDGRVFQVFRNNPNDANSLSGNIVTDIVQDKQGIYWIATADAGLTRYDAGAPVGSRFTQFKNNPHDSGSIAVNSLNCLYDWDEDYLLIGAKVAPGIFINKKTFAFSYWHFDTLGLAPQMAQPVPGKLNWVHHIAQGDSNTIYVSMLMIGELLKVDKRTGKKQRLHYTSDDVLSINHFTIAENKIWMACWYPGLFMQPDTFVQLAQKAAPIDDLLMCVCNLNSRYLLAGTRASGLCVVDKETGAFTGYQKRITLPHTLPSNKISCIFIDSRGITWVGTSAGLAKFDPQVWLFREDEFTGPETDCTILHSHRFKDGSMAVNTSKGMFLSDSASQKYRQIILNNRGQAVVPDYLYEPAPAGMHLNGPGTLTLNDMLLGTENGFFIWQKGSNTLRELKIKSQLGETGFYTQGVFQVKQFILDTVAGRPGLWMPVLGYGVCFYDMVRDSAYMFISQEKGEHVIGSNLARRMAKDRYGNIWVATAAGLYKWEAKTQRIENRFIAYLNEPGNKNSLPNNDVSDLWFDAQGHLWLTLNGGGLCEFNGTVFKQYLPQNPVSSRTFLGMYADERNRLWIITKNGLEVFDLGTRQFFHIDVNDGLANTALSPHFSNAYQGWLSFTSGNRVFTFRPGEMKFSTAYPRVYLVNMEVFGNSYLAQATKGEVRLSARERFVNFTVSTLQFTSPGTVRFQYKLAGLDEQWSNSDDGEIKYTNLPWGHFKLLVRVTNPSGQFGNPQVLAAFVIATPFYATWWFITLCVLFVAGVIYSFYRYRINQLVAMQKVRNKIARDLHDDIGSTLGSISFFSEAAKQQLEQENAPGAQKMLVKIGDTSREMVDNMSDIVWSVNPQNDSVKHLANRMRVFAGDLVATTGILLHFEQPAVLDEVKLSMEQRKNIFLVFKESIYNSVKYAGCKNIYVQLTKTDKGLLLKISDDGKGFDVNNYTSKNGNGLRNMQYRAGEIAAVYHIASSPAGTVTTLYI